MESRLYRLNVGFSTASLPDPGTPSNPYDLITLGFLNTYFSRQKRVTGTVASPYLCVAGTSIAHGLQSNEDECLMILKGSSGAVDMSANPQIAAGTKVGQRLQLLFQSNTDTVYLEDGDGLNMKNGNRRCVAYTVLEYIWDGTSWNESFWNNVGDLG